MDFSRILHRNSALEIQTMLRLEPTKPASLSRKGHRFCPAFWLSFWSFNTLLVKWRHVLTLLEKNRFCCAKIMGPGGNCMKLLLHAPCFCSFLLRSIAGLKSCLDLEMGTHWEHFLSSRLQISPDIAKCKPLAVQNVGCLWLLSPFTGNYGDSCWQCHSPSLSTSDDFNPCCSCSKMLKWKWWKGSRTCRRPNRHLLLPPGIC